MFSKLNFKSLLIVFGALLAIVVITKIIESKKGDRSFKSELITIDITDVTEIEVISKRGTEEQVSLIKTNDVWEVEKDGQRYSADQSVVQSVLNELINLKPQRVAATNETMWEKFEVTDSLGVMVIAKNKDDILTELIIGKFSYKQPTNQYQRQGTLLSYVRLTDDEKVYVVNGFLNMTFSRDLNTYRDKTITTSTKNDWTQLSFTSPVGMPFTLVKQNERWMVDGLLADSVKVEEYLTAINNLKNSDFVNEEVDVSFASNVLTIEGINMPAPIEIKAYPSDSVNQYVIISSLNSKTNFSGAKGGLFEKIFIEKAELIAQ